jgi:pimeloyl-ACP methyl ester carboxylesterase
MEAVRRFLIEKNDDGELNINKLCIVGSGMGASVAANWALQDWTAPPLATGKQGQDVKALVLISPRWSYNGLSMQDPLKFGPLRQNVSWLLVCGGKDAKVKADFERVEKQLERSHPLEEKKPGAAVATRKGLQVSKLNSTLEGDRLYSQSAAAIDDQVVKFLMENVAAVELPWTNRLNKLP